MVEKSEVIKKWLHKADIDLKTAKILFNSDDRLTESICFHAQQAVEKFLKAYLTYANIRAGKTHDIATLLELCINNDKDFEKLDVDKLENMTFYAVEVRYPDSFYIPSFEEASDAIALAESVRDLVVRKIEVVF